MSHGSWRLLAVSGFCLMVFAACSSSETSGTTAPLATDVPVVTTTSIPATTTTLPPEEAHVVDGEWLFTYVLESSSENFSTDQDPGDRDVRIAELFPTCEIGPCALSVEVVTPYLDQEPFMLMAEWSGESYEIVEERPAWGSCATEDGAQLDGGLDLRTTISLMPVEFTETEAGWEVASFQGRRILDWTPTSEAEASGCEPSVVEYAVTAVPHDPNRFVVPTSEPLPTRSVVFTQKTDEGNTLVAIAPDGSEHQVGAVFGPYGVSPDGGSVIHASQGGLSGLWLMASDGSDSYEFFPDARVAVGSELTWSRDGKRLAFVRRNLNEGTDVWLVEVPYGVPERVTEGGAALGGLTWGPNGESLLFDWGVYKEEPSDRGSTFDVTSSIYRYDLASSDITEVVSNAFRPAVGGGGTVLTYLVPDLDNIGRPYRWSIMRSNLDGSDRTTVLLAALSQCGPNGDLPCSAPISPDLTQIAFSDNNECQECPDEAFDDAGVWRVDLTSETTVQIAQGGWMPRWTR